MYHYDPLLPPFSYIPHDPSSFLQRTASSLSLNHLPAPDTYAFAFGSSPLDHSSDALVDAQTAPMRRVFSTGDMDPYRGEVETAAGARVGRYNAEERKERIERYRSKRNHRNFHKKITYACRKTLADSRPRVRGRFARNGEPEMEAEAEMEETPMFYGNGGAEMAGGCYDWSGMGTAGFDAPTAAGGRGEDVEYCYDSELWTNFLDVFAMNNLISE